MALSNSNGNRGFSLFGKGFRFRNPFALSDDGEEDVEIVRNPNAFANEVRPVIPGLDLEPIFDDVEDVGDYVSSILS